MDADAPVDDGHCGAIEPRFVECRQRVIRAVSTLRRLKQSLSGTLLIKAVPSLQAMSSGQEEFQPIATSCTSCAVALATRKHAVAACALERNPALCLQRLSRDRLAGMPVEVEQHTGEEAAHAPQARQPVGAPQRVHGRCRLIAPKGGARLERHSTVLNWENILRSTTDFSSRLAAVRSSDEIGEIRATSGYRNGQLLVQSDDVSQWDNYDRYFKFASVYVDGAEEPS